MDRMFFLNIPVTDLERSKAFYSALGFRNEPKFTDETAAAMQLTPTINVMLLTQEKFKGFTNGSIAMPSAGAQAAYCISCESADEARDLKARALAAGGAEHMPDMDYGGQMYGTSFHDPDGHVWEPMWMSAEMAEAGAHPQES
jgi:predicted lactoylglutathione lyase